MFEKIIFYARRWWILIVAIHIIGGNCPSRNSLPTPTPTTLPIDEVKPAKLSLSVNSLDSEASASSGVSSGDASSGTSSGYSSSGTSSGYSSSAVSTPAPPPAPPSSFAGLPNIGNTCYMNAGLQIIAALYADKVPEGPLKELITKINTTHKPLDSSDVEQFVRSLSRQTKNMSASGECHDPSEFIDFLNEQWAFLDPIKCIRRVIIQNPNDSKALLQKEDVGDEAFSLIIGFKKQSCYDLSEMISLDQNELIENEDVEECLTAIKSKYTCLPESRSAFLLKHAFTLEPIQGGYSKYYIRQVLYTISNRLYIRLNRYRWSASLKSSRKISDQVNGTMDVAILPDPNKKNTITFALNGYIVHIGDRIEGGHYIAYVKREGKWYEANDSIITEVSESQVTQQSKQAYLLFYKKR